MPDLLCETHAAAFLCAFSHIIKKISHQIIAQQPAALLRNAVYYAKACISISNSNAFRVIQTGVKELFEIRHVRKE